MVSINYASREVSCKIVYYGPGLSGKTTNLQYVHKKVPSDTKGKLISLATDADRTLYFDFLPINIGTINGFAAKFQLYTVPGQVYYNATRKLVLRGVDGLVFVADSQPDKMDENVESFSNLKENLTEYGYNLEDIPVVIQYNKQDLPGVLTPEQMHPTLNPHGWMEFRASATEGFGVFDTLKCILKLVLEKAKSGGTVPSTATATGQAPQPTQPQPAAVSSHPRPIPQQPLPSTPPPPVRPAYKEISEPVYQEPARPEHIRQETIAPAAQHPAPQQELTPVRQEIVRNPEPLQPAPAQPDVQPSVRVESVYRPFPGNTVKDEQRMNQRKLKESAHTGDALDSGGVGIARDSEAAAAFGGDSQPERNVTPTGAPRMEPPLRAEKPPGKRSFIKRLFGLK
jgi:signal recognition particle receptor subunit beta